jgi:hypothetical protein
MFFEEAGMNFEVPFCRVFPYSIIRKWAQFLRQSVQHLLLGQPYSVRTSGTEIEELLPDCSEGVFAEEKVRDKFVYYF